MRTASILSDRQRAVAELIAAGFSNRDIGTALKVGRRTVDTHVRHILRKLGLRSRVQIGVWVVSQAGDHGGPDRRPK